MNTDTIRRSPQLNHKVRPKEILFLQIRSAESKVIQDRDESFRVFRRHHDQKINVLGKAGSPMNSKGITANEKEFNLSGEEQLDKFSNVGLKFHDPDKKRAPAGEFLRKP